MSPSTRMEFLGTIFDTLKMTIEVSPERMINIMQELQKWTQKDWVTRKELESLIGKLNFISNCVRPGRIFISRLLNKLRGFPQRGAHKLDKETLRDVE